MKEACVYHQIGTFPSFVGVKGVYALVLKSPMGLTQGCSLCWEDLFDALSLGHCDGVRGGRRSAGVCVVPQTAWQTERAGGSVDIPAASGGAGLLPQKGRQCRNS